MVLRSQSIQYIVKTAFGFGDDHYLVEVVTLKKMEEGTIRLLFHIIWSRGIVSIVAGT